MGKHLSFGKGLSPAASDEPIRKTFLGQAHIAGTGPKGRSCRECRFWHAWSEIVSTPVGYEAIDPAIPLLRLKDAPCNKQILNKADEKVPHHASACMFFDENPDPQPPTCGLDVHGWHPVPHTQGRWKVVFGPFALKIARGPTGDRLAVFRSHAAAAQRAISMNQKELANAC